MPEGPSIVILKEAAARVAGKTITPADGNAKIDTSRLFDAWDAALVRKKLRALPDTLVCDALLDQTLFVGVGNIIKNEMLFGICVHPLWSAGTKPARKLRELVEQARQYRFEFLEWKKMFVLRKHWLAHNRSICPRDHIPFQRVYLGKTERRRFFCERCQKRYGEA